MFKTLHYFSGITICIFTALHLLNHGMILRSEAAHLRFMQQARKIYRKSWVETVLFTALSIQFVSGVILVAAKGKKAAGFFDWMEIFSGLYLLFFLIYHVTAVLIGRKKLRVDTDLYYGAGVMNRWPQKLVFIPYYSLAMLAFFFHLAAVHRVKMEAFVAREMAEQQAIAIMVAGAVFTFVVVWKMSRLKKTTH